MNNILTHFTQYIFVYMAVLFVTLQVVTLSFQKSFQVHQKTTILLISLGGGLLLPSRFQTKNKVYNLVRPIGKFVAVLFAVILIIGLYKTFITFFTLLTMISLGLFKDFFSSLTMIVHGLLGIIIVLGLLKFISGIFGVPIETVLFWNYIDKK